mmetsp:Transcript_4097/g.17157  ORF Transcript_4097/g.17157 Transcript_4097/m.17157 type:complete len:247 (+) Transcript_4097:1152-1892(+)
MACSAASSRSPELKLDRDRAALATMSAGQKSPSSSNTLAYGVDSTTSSQVASTAPRASRKAAAPGPPNSAMSCRMPKTGFQLEANFPIKGSSASKASARRRTELPCSTANSGVTSASAGARALRLADSSAEATTSSEGLLEAAASSPVAAGRAASSSVPSMVSYLRTERTAMRTRAAKPSRSFESECPRRAAERLERALLRALRSQTQATTLRRRMPVSLVTHLRASARTVPSEALREMAVKRMAS